MKKIQFAPKPKRVRYTTREKILFLEKARRSKNLREIASQQGVNLKTAQK